MKNKPLHTSGASEEPPKENDGEENDDGGRTRGTALNLSSERCPICLNYLSQDIGFPENCYHAFCVNCILKWSETSTSCPVDRKPFQIVYKINLATGCTKVHVKTKRPREQCCCNGNPLYSLCCAKTTIRYRTDSNKELSSHNIQYNKSDSCISKEEAQTSESELNNLTQHDPYYTSDFVSVCQQNGQLAFPLTGLQDVSEDVEHDLIQQKREGLKYLRHSGVARRSSLIMSLSGETEARLTSMPALSLDDYIPPLCNFSIRNQGFSTRTCVNSSVQEGTEKKAASGASNGRGSRRKTSQSTTRRRSTRNSKAKDVGHLPSSPKSNNSDRDSPDCNNSSANVSTAGQALKTPPKQRKRAPKKRAQTRKRLRSGTRTKEESSGSKENSAEESEEQPEKKQKILNKDSFETVDSDLDSSAAHNVEAVQERVDCRPSPPSSPIQLQSDENGPVSPPASTEHCSDEKTFDSSSPNEQETDLEDEPPSRNNHDLMEKKSPTPPTSINQDNSECEHSAPSPFVEKSTFNSDEECSDFKKPQSSEGENCSISSAAEEGDLSDHTKSPLFQTARRKGELEDSEASEKCRESDIEDNDKTLSKEGHESNISDSSSSDGNDSPSKSNRPVEYTRNRSASTESDDLSDSRNGPLSPEPPLLENALNASMDEKSLASDQENPPELDNSPDLKIGDNERNPAIEESASHQVLVSRKHSVEDAVSSPTGKYSTDEEADASTGSVKGKETTSEPDECPDRSPEIQTATTALQHAGPRASSSHSDDGSHDSNNNETERCLVSVDVTKNVSLQPSHEPSDLHKDGGSVSDQGKELCDEDNNESVAMECESLDSDHNESEIEQQTAKIKPPEPDAEIKEEVKAQSAETVHATDKTNDEAPKKETRPRRSRFHSPSTTWSPQKADVKTDAKADVKTDAKADVKTDAKADVKTDAKADAKADVKTDAKADVKTNAKADVKTDAKERQRSHSRGRDSPEKRRSRSRSKDRAGSRDRGGQWKGRSRERWHRRHSRSKSRSRSRSKSPSRPAARNKGPPPDRNEMDCGSPPWRERRQYDNWRSPRGNERYRRHDQDKPSDHFRREKHDINRDSTESYKDSSNQNDYPDWVAEKIKSTETRGTGSNRSRGSPRGSHWDSNHYSQGDSWNKSPNMDWKSPRGRGGRGRGRGGFRGSFGYGDQNENRWNDRPPFSGNSNSSGPESSRFPEQRNYRPKYEQELFDPPPDRSGWSSASSWAVRKTLPADVQNYYSKRGRGPVGSQATWPRQEESQDQAALKVDQPIQDQVSQPAEAPPMPVNMMPPQINVVQPQINPPPPPQPMNMFPYSVSVPPPPMVNIQHNPYSIHQQLPMHIHPGLPMQVPVQVSAPASVSQGLPPPPPPPPPSQQVNYVPSQQEAKPIKSNPPVASHVGNNFSAPILPAPTPTMGIVGTVLGPNAGIVASSTHSRTSHSSVKPPARKEVITVEATADSSKKEKIQERAAHEVKMAIKQYYQNKDITKDEYKEIVKKAVDKVCHSKSGEVDSSKVATLVKAYVDKYKHSRKKD
uniref:SR-related CTD associated factor 11 n=1 Tax=Leptobrachium leishanense TaxID=445787 RepID=A0A8C5MXI8_9ANUR